MLALKTAPTQSLLACEQALKGIRSQSPESQTVSYRYAILPVTDVIGVLIAVLGTTRETREGREKEK